MKNTLYILTALFITYTGIFSNEFTVIVNDANQTEISKTSLKRILVGKITKWDNGQKVVIVNVNTSDESFALLLKDLTDKDPVSFKEHWNKLQIQGKGIAPMIQSTAGAKALIANMPGGISFIEKTSVDESVKELQIK